METDEPEGPAGSTETVDDCSRSNDSAKECALSAERDYLARQFENASCVGGWEFTSYVGIEENGTVIDWTDEGIRVEVTQPYSYGTERDEVDSGSTALYLVSGETVRRVDGDDVSPC